MIISGYSQCSLKDISVTQYETGVVENKPEWTVYISNKCHCAQKNVKLNCTGFQTSLGITPSVLRVSGNECILNDGEPIDKNLHIVFFYVWEKLFPLNPISSEIICS